MYDSGFRKFCIIVNSNYKSLIKYLFTFIPAILIGVYIALNPISEIDHKNMAIFLKENFNENCYMSCALLLHKSSIYLQFAANFTSFSFEIFLRYFFIILVFILMIILYACSNYFGLNQTYYV